MFIGHSSIMRPSPADMRGVTAEQRERVAEMI